MNIAQLLPAALIVLMASTAASAFETVVKVISVTPGREIVNEPYESCGSNPAAGAPAQPGCRHADHYDVRVMYTVVYEYQGQRFSAKLPYDPGNELKVDVAVTPKTLPFVKAFKDKFGNFPSYAGCRPNPPPGRRAGSSVAAAESKSASTTGLR